MVVARVGLALPRPVGPALLDAVLLLLLRWLTLPPSTPATYAGAPTGTGDGVVYTFSVIMRQAGRLLQSGAAGIDALLDEKLNDGSLVAEVAASGLAPALGYDRAESLVNAVASLPALVVQPSVSPTPSPSPAAPPPPPPPCPRARSLGWPWGPRSLCSCWPPCFSSAQRVHQQR